MARGGVAGAAGAGEGGGGGGGGDVPRGVRAGGNGLNVEGAGEWRGSVGAEGVVVGLGWWEGLGDGSDLGGFC